MYTKQSAVIVGMVVGCSAVYPMMSEINIKSVEFDISPVGALS